MESSESIYLKEFYFRQSVKIYNKKGNKDLEFESYFDYIKI